MKLDALLRLVVELVDEAKDIARIDEADDEDVPRMGDLVLEDGAADPRFDEFTG